MQPGKTRFAPAFWPCIGLQAKEQFEKVVHFIRLQRKFGKEAVGRETADVMVFPTFWNNVDHAYKISGPSIKYFIWWMGSKTTTGLP